MRRGLRFSRSSSIVVHRGISFASPFRFQCAAPGLAWESAATVPMATPAAITTPTLMRMERARRCLAGAIAAPAGLVAVAPLIIPEGATAVPTGFAALSGRSDSD